MLFNNAIALKSGTSWYLPPLSEIPDWFHEGNCTYLEDRISIKFSRQSKIGNWRI